MEKINLKTIAIIALVLAGINLVTDLVWLGDFSWGALGIAVCALGIFKINSLFAQK